MSAISVPELSAVDGALWEEARRRLPLVRRVASDPNRTRAQVSELAAALGRGVTQTYALLRRFQVDPRLTSLLPQHRGPAHGYSRLTREVDALIEEVIEAFYLTKQRPKISDLVIEVRRRCHALGLTPPSRKGIRARLRRKSSKEIVARREGRKAARDRFSPAVGSLEPAYPLSLIQIDHTLADVIVVDSATRAPIQRPWSIALVAAGERNRNLLFAHRLG
jgi:putative transposase